MDAFVHAGSEGAIDTRPAPTDNGPLDADALSQVGHRTQGAGKLTRKEKKAAKKALKAEKRAKKAAIKEQKKTYRDRKSVV